MAKTPVEYDNSILDETYDRYEVAVYARKALRQRGVNADVFRVSVRRSTATNFKLVKTWYEVRFAKEAV